MNFIDPTYNWQRDQGWPLGWSLRDERLWLTFVGGVPATLTARVQLAMSGTTQDPPATSSLKNSKNYC
jgi:hypothetical protein